jgi:hypothetical protein
MEITRVVAVYNANGGLIGEAQYLLGHLFGTVSCALCDITHSPLRRKPAWDQMVKTLPYPLEVHHRNEVDDALSTWLTGATLPVVVAQDSKGDFHSALGEQALEDCGGSPDVFKEKLLRALESLAAS